MSKVPTWPPSSRRPKWPNGCVPADARRNAERQAIFDFTCQLAALEPPPPDMQHLLAAVAVNADAANRFVGLIAGTCAFEEFFAPSSLDPLLASAAEREGRRAIRPGSRLA